MIGVTHYTETFLEAIENELGVRASLLLPLNQTQSSPISQYWTAELTLKSGIFFSYSPECFLPTYLTHANSPSAWPTPAARQVGNAPNPLFIYFGWESPAFDNDFVAAMEESASRLSAIAQTEGLLADPSALYGNYVDANTPLVEIYGENLPKLQSLKAEIDPNNVMGLAGGFKF